MQFTFFNFIFSNSNQTNKSARETETRARECDNRCGAAPGRSLEGTLLVLIVVSAEYLKPIINFNSSNKPSETDGL
jgi:hypothetical protein